MSIKVYSTSTCPWCTKVKDFLKSQSVAFEEINVAEDREAARDLVAKTKQMGVPVTQIGEQYIVGYNVDAITAALKENNLI